jgi:hypothetical protein
MVGKNKSFPAGKIRTFSLYSTKEYGKEKIHHDHIDDNADRYLMIAVVITSTIIWSIQTMTYHAGDCQKNKGVGI